MSIENKTPMEINNLRNHNKKLYWNTPRKPFQQRNDNKSFKQNKGKFQGKFNNKFNKPKDPQFYRMNKTAEGTKSIEVKKPITCFKCRKTGHMSKDCGIVKKVFMIANKDDEDEGNNPIRSKMCVFLRR